MAKQPHVRLVTLARALAVLVDEGYGDCPLYVSTAHDIGPLAQLILRRRGSAVYLAENENAESWVGTVVQLKNE